MVENFLSRLQKYDRKLTIRQRCDFFFEALQSCVSGVFILRQLCLKIKCHLRVMRFMLC